LTTDDLAPRRAHLGLEQGFEDEDFVAGVDAVAVVV
jgi:hypothetical protein